jgi:hypothetical protein
LPICRRREAGETRPEGPAGVTRNRGRWGDDWLAEPEGPQVVFRDRAAGRAIQYPKLLAASGKPLRLEDVEVVAGSGAVAFNRARFANAVPSSRPATPPDGTRRKRK